MLLLFYASKCEKKDQQFLFMAKNMNSIVKYYASVVFYAATIPCILIYVFYNRTPTII